MVVNLTVDAHRGSAVAGTVAGRSLEGKAPVISRFANLDVEQTLKRFKQAFCVDDVDTAGRRTADLNGVFCPWFGRKLTIKVKAVEYIGDGKREAVGQIIGNGLRNVVTLMELLHFEQDADNLGRVVIVGFENKVYLCLKLSRQRIFFRLCSQHR